MNINFDRLRLLLQPMCLRKSGLLQSLIKAFFTAISSVKTAYDSYAQAVTRKLSYSSSVKDLRKAVSEVCGCTFAQVSIGDVQDKEFLVLNADNYGAPEIISNSTATALWSDDVISAKREFTITVPSAYQSKETKIKQIVDQYKLAGTKYTIIYS